MRAERDRRAAILNAEGEKKSAILEAEGIRESQIKRAEGEREAAILEADGEAQARIRVAEAERNAIQQIQEGLSASGTDPAQYLVAVRYLESLKEMTLVRTIRSCMYHTRPPACLGHWAASKICSTA